MNKFPRTPDTILNREMEALCLCHAARGETKIGARLHFVERGNEPALRSCLP
jgi:hypothetical protein